MTCLIMPLVQLIQITFKKNFSLNFLKINSPTAGPNKKYIEKVNKDFTHKLYPNVKFYQLDFIVIKKALNSVIKYKFPRLNLLVEYFKHISNISNKLFLPVP